MKIHHLSLRVGDFERSVHFYQSLTGLNIAKSFSAMPEPRAKYFYVYDPDGFSVQIREYR